MVFLSRLLNAKKLRRYLRGHFLDSLNLHVVGGSGGCGLPKYGGKGGQGGCVYCVATPDSSLQKIKQQYKEQCIRAGHGEDSIKNKILGQPGQDVMLEVPVGLTVIHNQKVLGEINEEGQNMILARGGQGGCEKNHWLGLEGQSWTLQFELRLIADIGLLGFPNAGKSTLLRACSRAKPKVASYPFTTVRPNIGIIEYPDLRQISMADLPGLVEGAHKNIGMGHRFLRHVERTKLLLMVVDIQGFALSIRHKHRTCLENILLLNKELELYNPELLSKPTLLVINKMDTPGAQRTYDELTDILDNLHECRNLAEEEIWPSQLLKLNERLPICAQQSDNIDILKEKLRNLLDEQELEKEEKAQAVFDSLKDKITERGPTLT